MKLVDENKLENEAEALIQHIKSEFKDELAVFNNTINVVYTERAVVSRVTSPTVSKLF